MAVVMTKTVRMIRRVSIGNVYRRATSPKRVVRTPNARPSRTGHFVHVVPATLAIPTSDALQSVSILVAITRSHSFSHSLSITLAINILLKPLTHSLSSLVANSSYTGLRTRF